MKMWFKCLFIDFVFVLYVLNAVSCKPFLHNLPRMLTTLATSASASASSPSQPLTNIANLRRKQHKAEQLQEEKQLVEDQDPDDNMDINNTDNANNNEVSPSLLQKKINKILTKISLISSLTRAFTGNMPTKKDDEFQKELNEFDAELQNDVNEIETLTSTIPSSTFQKIIYPQQSSGEPLRVQLNIRERLVNETENEGDSSMEDVDKEMKEMGRLGQVGVFFAELLGSLVGIAYGVAGHLNNGAAQATTIASN